MTFSSFRSVFSLALFHSSSFLPSPLSLTPLSLSHLSLSRTLSVSSSLTHILSLTHTRTLLLPLSFPLLLSLCVLLFLSFSLSQSLYLAPFFPVLVLHYVFSMSFAVCLFNVSLARKPPLFLPTHPHPLSLPPFLSVSPSFCFCPSLSLAHFECRNIWWRLESGNMWCRHHSLATHGAVSLSQHMVLSRESPSSLSLSLPSSHLWLVIHRFLVILVTCFATE